MLLPRRLQRLSLSVAAPAANRSWRRIVLLLGHFPRVVCIASVHTQPFIFPALSPSVYGCPDSQPASHAHART